MEKISAFEFEKILDCSTEKSKVCIEIHFCLDDSKHYNSCWLGKHISKDNKEVYWFGLTEDGLEAYDFASKTLLLQAKVFSDKSLKDIWEMVTIISIDTCEPKERLQYYRKNY